MQCIFKIDEKIENSRVCINCGKRVASPLPPEQIHAICGASEQQPLPSLLERAVSFGKAMAKHAADGGELCTEEEITARLEICQKCEFFIIKQEIPLMGKCSKCGCNCNNRQTFLNKLALPGQSCPLGHW